MLKPTSAAACSSRPSSHVSKPCDAMEKLCVAIATTEHYLDLQPRNTAEISYSQKAVIIEILGCR